MDTTRAKQPSRLDDLSDKSLTAIVAELKLGVLNVNRLNIRLNLCCTGTQVKQAAVKFEDEHHGVA